MAEALTTFGGSQAKFDGPHTFESGRKAYLHLLRLAGWSEDELARMAAPWPGEHIVRDHEASPYEFGVRLRALVGNPDAEIMRFSGKQTVYAAWSVDGQNVKIASYAVGG